MNVITFGMDVENISHYSDTSVNLEQVALMLQYLHINNWFDISQSLAFACDSGNIPRVLKSFSLSPLFSVFHFLFSFYPLPVFTIIQITVHIQQAYDTFHFLCLCERVCVSVLPPIQSQSVLIHLSISFSVCFGVFYSILHSCACVHIICVCQIVVHFVFRSMFYP